jgi:transcription factor C subunit 3
MWYALTSHEMDYKKVPAMQLMLLSIIAAHGADGILQPDLVRLSSQDKRSVPARTDELAKHGYIEKISVNQGMRTSLCIHKKFVKEGRFVKGSDKIEDVFHNRTMVVSNFVGLLYRVLQETPLFPMRDLRKRLV